MEKEPRPLVAVAMSGGVDSSAAAWLLARQGYPVIGMMLKLWNEEGAGENNRCCTPDAMKIAEHVAAQIGFPFYVIDAKSKFFDEVVQYFVDGYAKGITPNPCYQCNRSIRWGYLLRTAKAFGAEYIATGHYARIEPGAAGTFRLFKGLDESKDQSYILSGLTQEQLSQTLFPLGGYRKAEVRQMAREAGIVSAERPDSQDLCFLGSGDYRGFLRRHSPQTEQAGPVVTRDGKEIGTHHGLAFYTVGQRKGLSLNSPHPYYVLEKDVTANRLVVGTEDELGFDSLATHSMNWIEGQPPPGQFEADVKIRYKAIPAAARVSTLDDNRARIDFNNKMRDITPGQLAVVYQGDHCLGGGFIEKGFNAE